MLWFGEYLGEASPGPPEVKLPLWHEQPGNRLNTLLDTRHRNSRPLPHLRVLVPRHRRATAPVHPRRYGQATPDGRSGTAPCGHHPKLPVVLVALLLLATPGLVPVEWDWSGQGRLLGQRIAGLLAPKVRTTLALLVPSCFHRTVLEPLERRYGTVPLKGAENLVRLHTCRRSRSGTVSKRFAASRSSSPVPLSDGVSLVWGFTALSHYWPSSPRTWLSYGPTTSSHSGLRTD